jgi:hypothetical protein
MHELNVVDETFELKLAKEYHISIQVGLDGFSFCILDIRRDKYIVLRHIPLIVGKPNFLSRKIETIFDQEEILNAAYQSVSITYSTNKATLIPKELAEGNSSMVTNFTHEISKNEEVGTNNLSGFNYQLIYAYPKDLISLFNTKYTDFQFNHKSIPLLDSLLSQRSEKKKTLLLNFEKKYIRMIALNGDQILLYNSFYFKNETDFLYYTLNVCHSLQLDAERDEIMIGGYVANDSGYIRLLKKYISNIQFLKPSTNFGYGNIFDKTQKHQFVSLLNTFPCV